MCCPVTCNASMHYAVSLAELRLPLLSTCMTGRLQHRPAVGLDRIAANPQTTPVALHNCQTPITSQYQPSNTGSSQHGSEVSLLTKARMSVCPVLQTSNIICLRSTRSTANAAQGVSGSSVTKQTSERALKDITQVKVYTSTTQPLHNSSIPCNQKDPQMQGKVQHENKSTRMDLKVQAFIDCRLGVTSRNK